jgi:hypothetical protein
MVLALGGGAVPDRALAYSSHARSSRSVVLIRISRTELGRPIPSAFLGLSLEYSGVYPYAGTDPRAPNPVFVRLIGNLVPGQRPVLRIGGDSTDRSWWPVRGIRRPPGVTYALSPVWGATVQALARATGARLVLGINLLANSPMIASAEAHALIAGIGRERIAAFEIGNEPELYSTQAWYRTASGMAVPGRPPGYGFQTYLREISPIRSALPRVPLAGPATGALSWLSPLPQLLAAEPGLAQVTFHRYPLNRCVTDPSSPLYPTVARLLSSSASQGLVRGVAPYVALAHRRGLGFRVDELNAVTCGGKPGVSDTFASTLWALDTLLWMARSGVDAVDVHIHPEAPANQLFTFNARGGRWLGSVRPEYYGLLAFARAAPAGARLLRIAGRVPGGLRTWATLAPDGRIRLVLINDSLTQASAVLVRPPAPAGAAALERLLAPSIYATSGVTLAGQSFGSSTATGRPSGRLRAASVRPAGGEYHLMMPAASGAILSFPVAASS